MILAPSEKHNLHLHFNFNFYFMSVPLNIMAEILHFNMCLVRKLVYFIDSSFFIFLVFVLLVFLPSDRNLESPVNVKIKRKTNSGLKGLTML